MLIEKGSVVLWGDFLPDDEAFELAGSIERLDRFDLPRFAEDLYALVEECFPKEYGWGVTTEFPDHIQNGVQRIVREMEIQKERGYNFLKNEKARYPRSFLQSVLREVGFGVVWKAACLKSYSAFSSLYADLEKTLATEYVKELWLQKRDVYIKRLKEMAVKHKNDSQKLKAIKQSRERTQAYCIKAKISYGSKSQKGADTVAILCSTLLSAWWNKPKNFFAAYNQMFTA